ncbi:MAG: hypothetical protein NUV82_03115 [Candidatus Komeilibacteria bacterium]|nr:hypothetical protein [Candidatus Komeilibacteria bacterium]
MMMEESKITGWYSYLAGPMSFKVMLLWLATLIVSIVAVIILTNMTVINIIQCFLFILFIFSAFFILLSPLNRISTFSDDEAHYRWGYVVKDHKIVRYGKEIYRKTGESVHEVLLSRQLFTVLVSEKIIFGADDEEVDSSLSATFTHTDEWPIKEVLGYLSSRCLFPKKIDNNNICDSMFREVVSMVDFSKYFPADAKYMTYDVTPFREYAKEIHRIFHKNVSVYGLVPTHLSIRIGILYNPIVNDDA